MGAPADPLILSQRSRIVRFAVKHRIPAMYGFREFVSDGGLLSCGPNLVEMFRRSGARPDDPAVAAAPDGRGDPMRNRRSRQSLEGWLRRKTAPAPPVPKPARPPRQPRPPRPAPPKPR